MQTDFAKEPIVTHSNIALTSEEQIKVIRYHFREIMLALGLNLEDDSLKDTPDR